MSRLVILKLMPKKMGHYLRNEIMFTVQAIYLKNLPTSKICVLCIPEKKCKLLNTSVSFIFFCVSVNVIGLVLGISHFKKLYQMTKASYHYVNN